MVTILAQFILLVVKLVFLDFHWMDGVQFRTVAAAEYINHVIVWDDIVEGSGRWSLSHGFYQGPRFLSGPIHDIKRNIGANHRIFIEMFNLIIFKIFIFIYFLLMLVFVDSAKNKHAIINRFWCMSISFFGLQPPNNFSSWNILLTSLDTLIKITMRI